MNIFDKFEPHSSWIKMDPKDFIVNGVTETTGAVLLGAYSIGTLYGRANTVSFYNYGKADGFLAELEDAYGELAININEQSEYGIAPLAWEFFGKDKMLSVIKLVQSPHVGIVDLFFAYNQKMYSCHTYIPSEEKNLKLKELYIKYPNIRYMIDDINKLED